MSLSRFCHIVATVTVAAGAGIAPSAAAADTIYSRSPEASVLTANGRGSPRSTPYAKTGAAPNVDSRAATVKSVLGRESTGPKGDSRHKKIGTAPQPVTSGQSDVDTLGRAS